MLTRQGWTVLWGALALLGAGRVLGIGVFYAFGASALLLVVGAMAYVHLVRLDLEVSRRVFPARVHAGSTSRVEIWIRNLRPVATPLLLLNDHVSGTEGADMLIPPIGPGGWSSTSYRLPTARRGVLSVGPLRILVTDSFGLAQSTLTAAAPVQVTIFPRVDTVQPVPLTVGRDPLAGALQHQALSHSGDDFYGLRAYVMGDDLRRIHWPSTARHDELLVCQHEQPWQGRTTVLVDVKSDTYSGEGFEVAVSAAASIASANMQRNDLVRLITTDGRDSGFGMGRAHLGGILEHLAVVQPSAGANLTAIAGVLQRDKGSGGALVVIAGELPPDRASALATVARRVGALILVEVTVPETQAPGPDAEDGGRAAGRAPVTGATGFPTVRLDGSVPFKAAWNGVVHTRVNPEPPRQPAR